MIDSAGAVRPHVWSSLRLRLPLLISLLIVIVVTTFLGVAYREVKATLLQAATARAQGAADQLASLLLQSTQQRLAEMDRMAEEPATRDFLQTPGDQTQEAARARLVALGGTSPQCVELWNTAGQLVLSLSTLKRAAGEPPPGSAPVAAGFGAFRVYRDVVYSEAATVVPFEPPRQPRVPSSPKKLGYVVVRRPISAASTGDLFNRLVGRGAAVAIGNKSGDVWTDLSKVVPPPPVDLTRAGITGYRGAAGGRRLGALAEIRGMPWMVWVEFQEAVVLAPARTFLNRMVVIALIFLVVAAALASMLSARITTPLSELTRASEALANGEYSRRVGMNRRDEIGRLGMAFNAMSEQVDAAHQKLEERVQLRTARLAEAGRLLEEHVVELAAVNQELESFSYSVSHDLRAPLRHVMGFAALLKESASSHLDKQEQRYLTTISDAASRMGRLIDDLLSFSRMGRAALTKQHVNLADVVDDARREVSAEATGREIVWTIAPLPEVEGDAAMLRLAMVNLLSNAVKYTGTRTPARIEVGTDGQLNGEVTVFVRDNGVGFDMQYAHKLFGVFQRLHRSDEFDGTGIGLANVRRIIHRHQGRVWAEAALDRGATFYFSLPTHRITARDH